MKRVVLNGYSYVCWLYAGFSGCFADESKSSFFKGARTNVGSTSQQSTSVFNRQKI